MTITEQILTIAAVVAATMLTRFLPFLLLRNNRKTPPYIQYLGKVLPCAVFALLIVYCLRNVDLMAAPHGAPEFLAIVATVIIHLARRQMLLSIGGGTFFICSWFNSFSTKKNYPTPFKASGFFLFKSLFDDVKVNPLSAELVALAERVKGNVDSVADNRAARVLRAVARNIKLRAERDKQC